MAGSIPRFWAWILRTAGIAFLKQPKKFALNKKTGFETANLHLLYEN
jgi:hypothetical protein